MKRKVIDVGISQIPLVSLEDCDPNKWYGYHTDTMGKHPNDVQYGQVLPSGGFTGENPTMNLRRRISEAMRDDCSVYQFDTLAELQTWIQNRGGSAPPR
jgi:hypothetical protein